MVNSDNSDLLKYEQKWETTLKSWVEQQRDRSQKTKKDCENLKIKSVFRVLLAEDDDEMRSLLALSLREEGYEVTECCDGHELQHQIGRMVTSVGQEYYDIIISDLRMPGMHGLQALKTMHRCGGFPPMILITAFGDERTHAQAKFWGAITSLNKPFEIEELLSKIREFIMFQ